MKRLHAMLESVASELGGDIEHFQQLSRLSMGLGTRKQAVEILLVDDDCQLTSVVLPASYVIKNYKRWRSIARLAWQRNADTDIVTFTFDKRDRLVGRVRHPAATLDREEMLLYVRSLVRECDRFEYLLSGTDQH